MSCLSSVDLMNCLLVFTKKNLLSLVVTVVCSITVMTSSLILDVHRVADVSQVGILSDNN